MDSRKARACCRGPGSAVTAEPGEQLSGRVAAADEAEAGQLCGVVKEVADSFAIEAAASGGRGWAGSVDGALEL